MEHYISNTITPKISIAPMVDKTHRHMRYFSRILTPESLLYTEMLSALSIIHGDVDKILSFRPEEGNVALQIAASNPEDAYKAIKIAEQYNYSEINLNCGCPSDRVSGNLMGAALMSSKEMVYEILCAMKEATNKPVTIKHRIGIDGNGIIQVGDGKVVLEGYDDLLEFLETVSKAKPDRYTIHARSAILKGLSPKENREVPPLDYDMVYRVKQDFPHFNVEINGGFKTLENIKGALTKVDGVMLGRIAYEHCYFLAHLYKLYEGKDLSVINDSETLSRGEIIQRYIPYVLEELDNGISIHALVDPIYSLLQGQRGSKHFRQYLSGSHIKRENAKQVLERLLIELPEDILWNNKMI